MNKNAIQKYAIWARNELIEQVKQRAFQYGIDENGYGDENASVIAGRVLSTDEKRQRRLFVDEIKRSGYNQAIEEVAYTWFNRFVALRYMEVNDFLPTHIRIFSDASGNFNPEILTNVLHLDLPGIDRAKVSEYLNENKTEELYRYLLLTQCNALNELLPEMFERMGAYTELLLPNNILKPESVIGRLVNDIPEDDFRDTVEIIGWLYQYHISKRREQVIDPIYNRTVARKDVPAATQIFTPDWIVRYMVENSLGRMFAKKHPKLKERWLYYIENEHTPSEIKVEDVRLIDPCMGSGHILVYAFEVFMQIYISEGYSEREAAKLIIEKNIFGLEIDHRAYQLAYFALMMKARQYNRRILSIGLRPQLYEPSGYPEGMEYGSLVKVDKIEPLPEQPEEITLFTESYETQMDTWNFRRLLAEKYDVVITNPPYLNNFDGKLKDYVQSEYSEYSTDLFSVFIYRNLLLCKENGYSAYMTPNVWMFIKSYEKLRNFIIQNKTVSSLVQLAKGAFFKEATVDICTFVLQNNSRQTIGDYIRLEKFKGDMELQRVKTLEAVKNSDCNYRYRSDSSKFSFITGSPFAYWVGEVLLNAFSNANTISVIAPPRVGLQTGNNDLFMRNWFEIDINKIGFNLTSREEAQKSQQKWFPYNKGGAFRRWYGNRDFVVNWENDGYSIRNNIDANGRLRSRPQNTKYYFKPAITWSDLTSSSFSGRYCEGGFIFDVKGSSGFPKEEVHYYILGLLNSKISQECIHILNPTITTQVGDMARIPVYFDKEKKPIIDTLVMNAIQYSKTDWDSYETSWDFKKNPLICGEKTIKAAYEKWKDEADERFNKLKANEEELNRLFIEIYGLQDELNPDVEDKNITLKTNTAYRYKQKKKKLKNNELEVQKELDKEECYRNDKLQQDTISEFISYAVGCMLGRYSLDVEGIAYAGGTWDSEKYKTFPVDKDNILPICDDEYFGDDITGRFVDFVKVVYGENSLNENLRYIADALGGKGDPRDVIRNYFLKDFFKDHCALYSGTVGKRPIYWLFDSGKKNAFKALIYMHRYSRDLLAKLRTDYVHEQQERYRTQLSHIAGSLNTASGAERAKLLKQQDKLTEQLREITDFEEKVHHLADQNIMIDLDDGVKKNYEIFADVLAKI